MSDIERERELTRSNYAAQLEGLGYDPGGNPIVKNTSESFDIYFSDLSDDAKTRLLKAVGASSAKEMNWDMDILPLVSFEYEKVGDL
jgi:hypothetical protein